jgi:flagellar biosynthetic protein FliP
MLLALAAAPAELGAQPAFGPPLPSEISEAPEIDPGRSLTNAALSFGEGGRPNPISVIDGAAGALPGGDGAEGRGLSAAVNIMVLLTVLTLVPSITLMTTCFVRIIVVLGLLRQALGTQSLPPAQVTMALALFMTFMVMSPTLERIYNEAIAPYGRGEITDYDTLWDKSVGPLRDFMFAQIEATDNWESLYMVLEHQGEDISEEAISQMTMDDVPTSALIPAFMLSELKTSFIMGFRVYLPFLVIDIVIASVLISMSMMMLPPVLISLPFKLLLFVLVDGWQLVVGSLMDSFVIHPEPGGAGAGAAIGVLMLGYIRVRGAGRSCDRDVAPPDAPPERGRS